MPEDRLPAPSELLSHVWRFNLVAGIVVLAILFAIAPEVITGEDAVTIVRAVAALLALVLIAVGVRLLTRHRRAEG